jgi:hypothetical protein
MTENKCKFCKEPVNYIDKQCPKCKKTIVPNYARDKDLDMTVQKVELTSPVATGFKIGLGIWLSALIFGLIVFFLNGLR